MFKVIDYAGEVLMDGFPKALTAYGWLYQRYTADFIHEMQLRVIREEDTDVKSE